MITSIASQPSAALVVDDGRTEISDRFAVHRPAAGQRRWIIKVRPLAGGTAGMDAEVSRSPLAAALVRVAAGDRAALRMVYQDTSAKLFGVCLRILGDRNEAEDVMQDVYVTV
jgi:hypothetical protein